MSGNSVSTKENNFNDKKEIIPITPKKFEDVEIVIRKLKRKEGVIVDFEEVPPHIAQRMLDFLSGAVFTVNGSIKKLKYRMYILIPDGVKISSVRGA